MAASTASTAKLPPSHISNFPFYTTLLEELLKTGVTVESYLPEAWKSEVDNHLSVSVIYGDDATPIIARRNIKKAAENMARYKRISSILLRTEHNPDDTCLFKVIIKFWVDPEMRADIKEIEDKRSLAVLHSRCIAYITGGLCEQKVDVVHHIRIDAPLITMQFTTDCTQLTISPDFETKLDAFIRTTALKTDRISCLTVALDMSQRPLLKVTISHSH